jgi:hypothetical protein
MEIIKSCPRYSEGEPPKEEYPGWDATEPGYS